MRAGIPPVSNVGVRAVFFDSDVPEKILDVVAIGTLQVVLDVLISRFTSVAASMYGNEWSAGTFVSTVGRSPLLPPDVHVTVPRSRVMSCIVRTDPAQKLSLASANRP